MTLNDLDAKDTSRRR